MKRAYLRQHGKGATELIEESFHLLRSASSATLSLYYVGAAPFIMGLLFFWAVMSTSPDASRYLGEASLGMCVLFFWMKLFQALFMRQLRAELMGRATFSWHWRKVVRTLSNQILLQTTGLFLLPIALLIALPFGWVYAFYQNVSALDDGSKDYRTLFREAWGKAALWPGQNHVLFLLLSGFGFFIFLNLGILAYFVPELIRMFLGIDSLVTQNPMSLFNTTTFAVLCGLSYLALDPLMKAAYVVRCFYGDSLQSGIDLKTEIRFAGAARTVAAALLLCLFIPQARAAEPAIPVAPAPSQQVSTANLDKAIDTVIKQPKYSWRMPREAKPENKSWFGNLLRMVGNLVGKVIDFFFDMLQKLRNWLYPDRGESPASPKGGWTIPQILLVIALIVTVGVLVFILIRFLKKPKQPEIMVESQASSLTPDLTDENVAADALPEDSWIKLGRELLGRGEYRLALRAFYLASLAHLAATGLITIARFKSNRDYERELRRRGHSLAGVLTLFSENVGIFDSVWYGFHDVNSPVVERFLSNTEKIKADT